MLWSHCRLIVPSFFGLLFWIGVLSLVMQHMLAVLFVTQGRLRAGPNLLGSQCLVWHLCVVIAPPGAVTMVGGSLDPSVPWSPGVTLQEKAGRPMGPSTLRCEFPLGSCCGLCRVFVLCSSGFCLFFVMPLLSLRGRRFVLVPLSPSRPDPCSVFVCVRLLLLSG